MITNEFNNGYKSDKHNQNMTMSKCFSDISYVMRKHVKNNKAALYCSIISFTYFLGFHGLAQSIHTNFLTPSTTEHDWILVKLYGKRIGLTD